MLPLEMWDLDTHKVSGECRTRRAKPCISCKIGRGAKIAHRFIDLPCLHWDIIWRPRLCTLLALQRRTNTRKYVRNGCSSLEQPNCVILVKINSIVLSHAWQRIFNVETKLKEELVMLKEELVMLKEELVTRKEELVMLKEELVMLKEALVMLKEELVMLKEA
jgi:hypothetical protein